MLLEQVILQREKKPFLGFFNHFSVNIFLRDEREKKNVSIRITDADRDGCPPPLFQELAHRRTRHFFSLSNTI